VFLFFRGSVIKNQKLTVFTGLFCGGKPSNALMQVLV
jgi:hypothetical protein